MKHRKRTLFQSVISLILCLSMLVGTTFAWFSDSVSSRTNMIAAGSLNVELEYQDADGSWKTVDESTEVLDKTALWEPGYTEVVYLRIANAGSLALKYALGVGINRETGSINAAGNKFFLSDYIRFGVIESTSEVKFETRETALKELTESSLIIDGPMRSADVLNKNGDVRYVTLVVYMPEEVGNAANYATGVTPPEIELGIKLVATQTEYESDSFGTGYDSGATLADFNFSEERIESSASAGVGSNGDNTVSGSVTLEGEQTTAVIPEGVLLEDGAKVLTLKVASMDQSGANITLEANEAIRSLDVHVDGISKDNTVPMEITIKEAAAKGLNAGNLKLFHVENGTPVAMTAVEEFTAHNQFKYDPATGDITLYMATFSEVALVADTENAWNGTVATAFAGGEGKAENPYIIANADQLAYLNECISNDNENYGNKHYKLVADINLGGEVNANKGIIFYPIGYRKVGSPVATAGLDDTPEAAYIIEEGTRTPGSAVANSDSSVWYTFGGAFKGTFDGNGHKISNIYQNTWQLKGNYAGNYWNAAMGLFGYVNGGVVRNLTVDNFSSDGEFTPTGVIAAYAVNSTFENIAITNCNPRVYNTGNGGIVGIGGNSDDPDSYKLTFTNITIDNTNKISALWGSWDVACGGLVGMFRGAGHVYMTNCHVAAQIDVYNDVCGNYQYYWYRYAGMMVGTNKNMYTDANGYTVPETSKFHATDCTVHFGEWNDYYYCELVANSLASYTHDHQFSRLTEIKSLDEIKRGDTWTQAGNFLLVSGDTKTCYHIVNKNGTLTQHLHADAGEETVNGNTVLKEDKQIVYLPFNQLFTGYGWGVKHVPIYNDGKTYFEGITILDREVADSVEKFETKFTGDFLYRVGNANGSTVSLGTLFETKAGATINSSGVWVTIDKVDENTNVSGTFKANTSDWTKGTIQFSGTGVVKVTIQDYDYCKPTELYLEVVDAMNATTATSATKNNVVLLNDCGFSSLEVSGGYMLYGNGFTMTCGSDSAALDMGYGFVTLNNGTLDNVQIECPNFDYAVLYKSNMTESGNRSETTDKTRYFNVKSGVMVSGNSQILNSRISGGRAAVNVSGGNVVIDNSRIELGAVASILVGAANKLTLRNVTLVQKPAASTYDSSKTLMGFSVLFVCDANGDAAPVTLEGTLVQNAWVDETDKQYVPSAGQSIISTVLEKTEYLHDLDGDGKNESLNLGFAYMPESLTSAVNATTITDNRTNKDSIPYDYAEVSILNGKTYVYSYKNTNGTDESVKQPDDYTSDTQSDNITVTYSDIADGLTTGKSYGTDGWVYELNVDMDKLSGYALDFSKLSMSVNGVNVTEFKVNGADKPASPVPVAAGGTTYILTATVNGKTYTANYKVTGTETSKESPSLVGTPSYGAGFGVANKYGGDWSAAAPVLDGITVKYWSVADSEYKEFALSSITFANTGKQNGTNNYWEYTHANNDFTLKLTNTAVIHSSSGTYGMPVAGKDGKLYFTVSSSGGFVSTGTTSRSITIAYEFTDNNGGDTLKFSHTWSVPYSKDEQYNYSSFTSDGTLAKLEAGSSSGCVTPNTLITLADGSQVRVDSLTGNEELLVWNLETGKYDTAPIVFVDSEQESEYEIIHLYFSDGSDVKVIYEHGFFDLDLGEYVYIDAQNYADCIGHRFVTEGDIKSNSWNIVTLDEVIVETEVTTAWSPVTFEHLCYYSNGVLSMPGGIEGLFNIFEVNTNTMHYDAEKVRKDIETYGLFTIEDFGGMITEEAFAAFNGAYLKVAMGKGLLTWEDIAYMTERYIPLM